MTAVRTGTTDLLVIEPACPSATADVVGGKAAGLIRMARAGLPVPPAFVLSTALCRRYQDAPEAALADARALTRRGMAALEASTTRTFGDRRRPLLVSVRSGAAVSMPGMLETVLNVGLTPDSVRGLIRQTGNPRFAWDCYVRLIRQLCTVAHGGGDELFADAVAAEVQASAADAQADLDFAALERLAHGFRDLYRVRARQPFPADPYAQLDLAVEAVLRSWRADKAREFRRLHGLSDAGGTAVTVQAMVFGNAGADCGAGVGFTRHPDTGERQLYLDFLFEAQGEDVVSGRQAAGGDSGLRRAMPEVRAEIERVAAALEAEFRDMQDFEITVEAGRLWLLQTRPGYRSPLAAVRIAVDMVGEGLVAPATALARLDGIDLENLEWRRLAVPAGSEPLARGIPAGAGVAVGAACFDAAAVDRAAARGEPAILLRRDFATADIAAIAKADGVITAAGARTAHAAVVARQMGKACIVGCTALTVPTDGAAGRFGDTLVAAGDSLSMDGETGAIYRGALPVTAERPDAALAQIARWRAAAAKAG